MARRLALLLALLPGALMARLTLPMADLAPSTVDVDSSLAVWSSTSISLTAGAQMNIILPDQFTLANVPDLSTCECVAMKFTHPTTLKFWGEDAANERLVTAGFIDAATRTISITLPTTIGEGKFYIRIRKIGAGLHNPTVSGLTTLALVDTDGVTTTSKSFFVSPSVVSLNMGSLQGNVIYSGMGRPAGSVLVMAATDGAAGFHPTSNVGPQQSMKAPRSVTSSAYTGSTQPDGSYRLFVPAGTYYLQALAQRVTKVAGALVLQVRNSPLSAATVVVKDTALTVNLTVDAFP